LSSGLRGGMASGLHWSQRRSPAGSDAADAGDVAMHAVQIVIADSGRAEKSAGCGRERFRVRRSLNPSPRSHQVVLVDDSTFRDHHTRWIHPERVVLLAPRPDDVWEEALRAGVVSIVSEADSLETLLMAILCADLRLSRRSGCRDVCANIPKELCPLRTEPQRIAANPGKNAAQENDCSWQLHVEDVRRKHG
jgi:hypothetical protein